ncbi:MAG: PfkB family carbohydrate kinase [Bacillota bacterium]
MEILIVGSMALDSIETPFGNAEETIGGSAIYASLSASYFHSCINLVGVIGMDFPGETLQFLTGKGIDLKGVQTVPGKTFRWKGYYDYDLNTAHTLDTQLNVFADFDPVLPDEYLQADLVFLANIDPELQLKVLSRMKQPRLVVCDTMNYWIATKKDKLRKLFEQVDMVILNDAELREYTMEPNLIKASKKLLKIGPKLVIIKKGEHGAFLFSADGIFSAPAFPLENVLDPTGAGDTFAGGVIGSLAGAGRISQKSLRTAIMYGTVMASFNVEDFGIKRLGSLDRECIENRFEELKKITALEII